MPESITLENGLDVADYFDQLMNQHFAAVPHIIRDEEDNLILVYGPMSLIVSLNEHGALAVISIYIDTRDEEESIDEYGYIEGRFDRTCRRRTFYGLLIGTSYMSIKIEQACTNF